MVNGYEKVRIPCAVVDVDGTVICGNSMREMIRFMLRGAVAECEVRLIWAIALRLLARRLRLITHRVMKHPVHLMAEEYMADSGRMARFIDLLMAKVHPGVMKLIRDQQDRGVRILFATAAPDVYMQQLAKALGADGYTATESAPDIDGYCENRGAEKLARAQRYAADRGWEISCVVTDHKDDLPLLSLMGVRRVLVAPDCELCRSLEEAGLEYEVIR